MLCQQCQQNKPEDEFYQNNKSTCKACSIAKAKRKQEEDPVYHMWLRAKHRAKENNLEFTIQSSDIEIPDICPVLGVTLERSIGSQGPGNNSPSLDRIDPNKGYTPDNIKVISSRANSLKSNATLNEILSVANYMRNPHGTKDRKTGSSHPNSKLTEDDVREMRKLHKLGMGRKKLAKRYGVAKGTVERILKRESWKHID